MGLEMVRITGGGSWAVLNICGHDVWSKSLGALNLAAGASFGT